ncbi:MAG: cell division protein FtsL [Polyangiales bacterium]
MKASFLHYWTIAVCAMTLAFGVHLLLLSENAHMSYQLSDLKLKEERLKAQRNLLALEAATLRQVDRVEAIARGSFGMEVPPASRVIVMDNNAQARVAGRTR